MNKKQKLVQQAFLNNEEAVIKELEKAYDKSLKDLDKKTKELQKQIDTLDLQYKILDPYLSDEEKEKLLSMRRSKVYQKEYQESLKKQVSDILDKMHDEEFKTVEDYLNKCYEEGFLGTMYDLQGQGIPLCFPMDQEAMVRAVQLDSKIKKGLYSHLGENVKELKKNIASEISRGIATDMSYAQIAQQLSLKMKGTYQNPGGAKAYAMRIARTEGHRIQIQGAMDACYKAKEKGADVLKQWDSTLDGATRPSHQKVDGEIKELDEKFSNGLMFPGDPDGGAAEVVNCRCALLQRAKWALDDEELETLKERAKYFGLDKNDSFDEFKKKYLKAANLEDLEKQFSDMTDGYSYDDFMNDFGSIEEGFDGMDDVEIQKAKAISEKIESLRSKMNLKANRTRTKQESIEILKNLGIEFKDSSAKPISDEVLNKYVDFVTGFENTHARYFNSNKVQLKKISIVDDVKGVHASGIYRSGTKGIEIKRARIQSKQSPIFSKSDDNELHVLAHEYGHYISDTLENNLGITEADIVQKTINKYYDGDIFKSTKDLKDCLSSYASTSYQEAFAEAFAEAYTCENPRKFARIFREELEKVMK